MLGDGDVMWQLCIVGDEIPNQQRPAVSGSLSDQSAERNLDAHTQIPFSMSFLVAQATIATVPQRLKSDNSATISSCDKGNDIQGTFTGNTNVTYPTQHHRLSLHR
jgi:hypothetical protein